MGKTEMNRQLGTKWFTFYTKVRPFISCLASLPIVVDFLEYTDIYLGYWWMLLYFLLGIAQPVFAIIVFTKSRGDYGDFVRFVKGVLIFETISMAYNAGLQQYSIVITIVMLLVGYLLWYKLNLKYFEKRIVVPECDDYDFYSEKISTQYSELNEVPKTYDTYNVYGSEIEPQTEDEKETSNDTPSTHPRVHFCRICGNKLLKDSLFCSNCGTKVIFDDD